MIETYKKEGYAIQSRILSNQECNKLTIELSQKGALDFDKSQDENISSLLNSSEDVNTIISNKLMPLVGQILHCPVARNAYILDKTVSTNWSLEWHQDLFVSFKQFKDGSCDKWMKKGKYWFAIPPLEVLEDMVIARINLDEGTPSNGSMQVLPNTHSIGMVCGKYNEIIDGVKYNSVMEISPERPYLKKGSLMLFSPLLVHNSPASNTERNRRVLQIEFLGKEAMQFVTGIDM